MFEPTARVVATSWQRLFYRPLRSPSPPWGSVWLDRESVLFGVYAGATSVDARNGIQFDATKQAEDHFWVAVAAGGWLAENDRHHEDANNSARHLFPWSSLSGRIYRSCRIRFIRRWGNWRVLRWRNGKLNLLFRRCKTVIRVNPYKGRVFTCLFSHY
ncbi:molecular chaperone TorD family protein [Salmonella enterica subsp. enterica]|nr:molecular chaperone TorD family protein [Salmonella enterica subsp. enterica]